MTSGDGSFGSPQWARLLDGRVHGLLNDDNPIVMPDIHLDRLAAEYARAFVLTAYYAYLRPWFRCLNCVTHFGQRSHLHDKAGFRYNILSAIAVAPQVCFCDVPEQMSDEEAAFAHKWLNWADKNKDYFKQCSKLFLKQFSYADTMNNASEGIEGFAHIKKDRGFIFLINPSFQTHIASLQLQLDVDSGQDFTVKEIYPRECTLKDAQGCSYKQDQWMKLIVPAKQIRILWIEPKAQHTEEAECLCEAKWPPETKHYVGDWQHVKTEDSSIVFQSKFFLEAEDAKYLSSTVDEALWQKNPWAYEKLYALIILRNDTSLIGNGHLPNDMDIRLKINGIEKTAAPFMVPCGSFDKPQPWCRCYFTDITSEAKSSQPNELELALPRIRQGLTFKGVYIDSPEQMPYALPGQT